MYTTILFKSILIALAMVSAASAGMPAIQQSSGAEYWVYDIAKCDNGSIIFYVDETAIPRLDTAEGIIFAVGGGSE